MTRRREYVLGFPKSKIPPGGKAEVSAEPEVEFMGNRLIVPGPPEPKWWRLRCALASIVINTLTSWRVLVYRLSEGVWTWRPLYWPPDDYRILLDIKVDGRSQFHVPTPEGGGFSLAMFHPGGVGVELRLEPAGPGKLITLVVENRGAEAAEVNIALAGYGEEPK
jgi:hypothetical protein